MTRSRRRGDPRPEDLEEIEYRPTTVKALLTEMKDVSELIVDLAYSAVAFDNEDIAAEVTHLETRMDTLNYRIRITAMMAARTVDDAERLAGILQVAQAAESISNAAGDIAHVLRELETRPYLPQVIQRAEERLKQVEVEGGSEMVGETLGELEVETETGMRVVAIRRGWEWIYGPGPETVLEDGDSLIARGTDEGGSALEAWSEAGDHDAEEGATTQGTGGDEMGNPTIANLLLDLKDTSELMVDLSYSSFLYDREEIAEEVFRLEDDVDHRNGRVQRRAMELHDADDVSLDQALATIRIAQAAEVIADSATAISDAVLRDVETHPVFRMSMEEADVQIARVVVAEGAALDGSTLGDQHVATATGMRIIAIRRGEDWVYGPGRSTTVEAEDVLVARGPDEGLPRLEEMAQEP